MLKFPASKISMLHPGGEEKLFNFEIPLPSYFPPFPSLPPPYLSFSLSFPPSPEPFRIDLLWLILRLIVQRADQPTDQMYE